MLGTKCRARPSGRRSSRSRRRFNKYTVSLTSDVLVDEAVVNLTPVVFRVIQPNIQNSSSIGSCGREVDVVEVVVTRLGE